MIDTALSRGSLPGDTAQVEAFLRYLFTHSFEGLPNRSIFEQPLNNDDLPSIARSFEALYAYARSGKR
jgi:hypothetical protein